jgi:glutathione gamma-glutamylcysteinyltransferase
MIASLVAPHCRSILPSLQYTQQLLLLVPSSSSRRRVLKSTSTLAFSGRRRVKKHCSNSSQRYYNFNNKQICSFSTLPGSSDDGNGSSTADSEMDDNNIEVIHCSTCTCQKNNNNNNTSSTQKEEEATPKWSFYKRILPNTPSLLAFSSEEGKLLFRETLTTSDAANAYFPLSEQFVTQSEPAYCGLTTLAMVLNALSIDPNVRWRGGWRWFDEQVLIHACCMDMDTVKRVGVTLDQFVSVARCNGAKVLLRRPQDTLWTEEEFRNEIRQMTKQTNGFLVVSYSRKTLGQTGDGHFSPVAAYHEERDMALILDVARFKYSPYWYLSPS